MIVHLIRRCTAILLMLSLPIRPVYAADEFRLIFFYQSGIDDDYVKILDDTFFLKLQQLSPLGSAFALGHTVQDYKLADLQACVESRYTEPSPFPEMTAKAELVKAIKTLVAGEKLLSIKSDATNDVKRLGTFLAKRWFLRRQLADALVVCYRQDPRYKTKSMSYPVFYVVAPAIESVVERADVASLPKDRKAVSTQDLLQMIGKSQNKLRRQPWAEGETFQYERSLTIDPAKYASERPEIILLSPHFGMTGFRDIPSAVVKTAHELGHYLTLAHVNTMKEVLARIRPRAPETAPLSKICADLVVFDNSNRWKINDQDFSMSSVTDTASFISESNVVISMTEIKAEAECYEAQKRVIQARGLSTTSLVEAYLDMMSYGVEGTTAILPAVWSASQVEIATNRARALVRSASGQ